MTFFYFIDQYHQHQHQEQQQQHTFFVLSTTIMEAGNMDEELLVEIAWWMAPSIVPATKRIRYSS